MKFQAIQTLRARLAADQLAVGLWVTLESPSITEIAVSLGLDWVVIDAEHGQLDWQEIVAHLRATARSNTVALVRIEEANGALVKRALDCGADGVVVPWVESAEQLAQIVAWSRYPLEGLRGIGGERATAWGQCSAEHTAGANDHVLVVPIIETVSTIPHVPAMCQVPGVELFYFGPADFSSTAGYRGQWEGPGVAEQILAAKDTIRQAGKNCGLLATSAQNLLDRQAQGFRLVGLGSDAVLLIRAIREMQAAVGREQGIRLPDALPVPTPAGGQSATIAKPTAALDRPPESFRPDRSEVMATVGSGPNIEIAPGVRFDCLVGAHNGARQLTTGLVALAPGAELPYHLHTVSESVTLLAGELLFEVEGRGYELEPLDNVVVTRGLAHCARNLSATTPAVLHVAMPTDSPARILVERPVESRRMPATCAGSPGRERVNRIRTAPRFAAGPNTEFVDFFNDQLVPGIEMSGGWSLFHPGGRLPSHLHDFDESISIIAGGATCVVEGRKFSLADCATALVPRGRVHYFVNPTNLPMQMIWVYAGPKPERIVVDERCATVEGCPWK